MSKNLRVSSAVVEFGDDLTVKLDLCGNANKIMVHVHKFIPDSAKKDFESELESSLLKIVEVLVGL